ncbi:MAG: acyl-CoA dehydrogenase family protein [Acidobacteriota bacterium]|nr:acyl-CoA dehydrogenase family protein [Blastocatellia bacterium]MDW8240979.1 acyl-CoA dehydrogenase family protein [Acidobacteriota bacterium]
MIDFEFTEEQLAVEKMVREFAANEVAPRIRELDAKGEFDPSIPRKMGELGILGICVPEQYGGAGADYISFGLACEELEYVDTFLRVFLSVHTGLNCLTLLAWGNEDQKQRYLVPQAKGEKLATYALTEPNAGSDAVGIQSTAVKDGDDYVLNGEKIWISLADVADSWITFAWTDQEKKKNRDHSGISAFIVERGFDGVKTGTLHGKLGVRAGNTGWISYQDVRVPKANLLGEEGEGFKIAMFCLDNGRYTVAAGATGLIRACRDASVRYALERKTFGQPIAHYQLVKEMIAEMEADYQSCRLLWLKAGWMKNVGLRNTKETSLAKLMATVASERAAGNAVQIYGAYGFSNEYPVERFYRNCKGAVIYEGTREIHKLMQADYVLGLRKDKPTRVTLPAWEPKK